MIDMWLARHTPEKVIPILHKVLNAAKENFADAVASGGGIYGVGYCVGGKYILMLGGEHPQSEQTQIDEEDGKVSKGPYIKTGTIAHGTLIEKEDIEQLKVPVSFACVGKF